MTVSSGKALLAGSNLQAFLRRLGTSLAILLIIAYLTLFGLIVGERGKAGLPARPLDATVEALHRTVEHLINHPTTYHWHRQDVSALGLVFTLFGRSAVLLLTALGIATLLGVPLGIVAALLRRLRAAPLVLLLSVLGVSTPSFLLAMLFWVINVKMYHWLELSSAPFPPTGFGWDAHIVMPTLVLATRPLAQIVQVTYISLSDVLGEDYIRTAHAKGLARRVVISRHTLRNVLIPILTTLGTSLRFSLASLPVVEAFFNWPGVGLALLQALEGPAPLVIDLIVSLGFLFLLINLGLDVIYQLVDPRLREDAQVKRQQEERRTWRERISDPSATLRTSFGSRISDLGSRISDLRLKRLPGLRRRRVGSDQLSVASNKQRVTSNEQPATSNQQPATRSRSPMWMVRSILSNFPLLVGSLLVLVLLGLAIYGEQLTTANPYETHGVMIIEEKIAAPPFPPSTVFPWGSDAVGRDIQALVLAGAKQTLTLALLGMMARMLLGTLLGVLAGWWQGGWLDHLINGAVAVWAAFPVTLFAMILILALGIQQGMIVFVVALCVAGWGEIAQSVRGQVIGLKPQPYIEAARSVGARAGWMLTRHILPHLWAPLLVLAILEMGSILMLLAELGFLNIFLGGGFKAEIAEGSAMRPVIYYFSDVPEWGALLANIRNWWRSYPWLAWYPGGAFLLVILAFNLWGEGLRRLLEDTRINLGRLINRYTIAMLGLLVLGGGWLVRSTTPLELYRAQAQHFDVQRAMEDIRALTSPGFQGRESGTPGAQLAAEYIATQMEDIGLFPAGNLHAKRGAGRESTYLHAISAPRLHLADVPRLEIVAAPTDNITGDPPVTEALVYRQDFVEYAEYGLARSEGEGAIVGLAAGPDPGDMDQSASYNVGKLEFYNKVILMREGDYDRLPSIARTASGILLIPSATPSAPGADTDETVVFQRRYLFPNYYYRPAHYPRVPVLYITPRAADQLLATAGSSLAQLDALAQRIERGQVAVTGEGARVRLTMPIAPTNLEEKYYYVIGFIPGTGAMTGEGRGMGMDNRVVLVSAYYDGLGTGPDGTFYPGANDNASGVATMLELARVLKRSPFQPKKTIVFVAWSGGERSESLSVTNAMGAKRGFDSLTVETVIELSGVGAGRGKGIALGQGTGFSLVQLFQEAASRVGVPITTRGRGPHSGIDAFSDFGGRSALSAYVSWDGSDAIAHTPEDNFEAIEPDKLEKVGQTTLLVLSVLGRAESQESPPKPPASARRQDSTGDPASAHSFEQAADGMVNGWAVLAEKDNYAGSISFRTF